MDSTAPRAPHAPDDSAAGVPTAGRPAAETAAVELHPRLAELARERDQLAAVVEIQREMLAAASPGEVLQTVTRTLGASFALDRCSIYLAGAPGEARLVASYENPAIRNLVVDLERYPELRRALDSGTLVFIPDARQDAALASAHDALAMRNVGAIAVVPMRWRERTLGAIFLRTDRDAQGSLSAADLRFCEVVAALAAQALFSEPRADAPPGPAAGSADGQRAAVLAFVRRLLERAEPAAASAPAHGAAALDQLVDATLRELAREAGR